MTTFEIAGRAIGPEQPPYIIAEVSGNHNQDLERAFRLIDAAKVAGVDAVKLQTYTAETITIDNDSPEFRIGDGLWAGRSLFELYEQAHTPWDWHPKLFDHARTQQLTIFSSPFDPTAVEFLAEIGAPAYKIASFEAMDLPLIECAARHNKPLIISTGVTSLEEVGEAVAAAQNAGNGGVALLHCVSAYPAPVGEANLRTIQALRGRFGVVVGLSDHTLGTVVSAAAIAQGASIIEKHFTLDRSDGGPDAEFSLEPDELTALVENCRTAWEALGGISHGPTTASKASMQFRRSLYAVEDIQAGEILTKGNVRSIRPGLGLPPKELPVVLGQRAKSRIARGTPLDWSLITEDPDTE